MSGRSELQKEKRRGRRGRRGRRRGEEGEEREEEEASLSSSLSPYLVGTSFRVRIPDLLHPPGGNAM